MCNYLQPTYCFCTGEEKEDADLEMPKVYEPIESFESLKERLNMFLSQYNETIRGTGMDMVFFQDAMIHLIKVPLNKAVIIQKDSQQCHLLQTKTTLFCIT